MTRDDIVKMALEAGIPIETDWAHEEQQRLKKDAMRYRWLRFQSHTNWAIRWAINEDESPSKSFDQLIDEAMLEGQKGDQHDRQESQELHGPKELAETRTGIPISRK